MILEFFFDPKTHLYVKNKAKNEKFRSKLTKAPDFWLWKSVMRCLKRQKMFFSNPGHLLPVLGALPVKNGRSPRNKTVSGDPYLPRKKILRLLGQSQDELGWLKNAENEHFCHLKTSLTVTWRDVDQIFFLILGPFNVP